MKAGRFLGTLGIMPIALLWVCVGNASSLMIATATTQDDAAGVKSCSTTDAVDARCNPGGYSASATALATYADAGMEVHAGATAYLTLGGINYNGSAAAHAVGSVTNTFTLEALSNAANAWLSLSALVSNTGVAGAQGCTSTLSFTVGFYSSQRQLPCSDTETISANAQIPLNTPFQYAFSLDDQASAPSGARLFPANTPDSEYVNFVSTSLSFGPQALIFQPLYWDQPIPHVRLFRDDGVEISVQQINLTAVFTPEPRTGSSFVFGALAIYLLLAAFGRSISPCLIRERHSRTRPTLTQ
jgi:hypothetical protein